MLLSERLRARCGTGENMEIAMAAMLERDIAHLQTLLAAETNLRQATEKALGDTAAERDALKKQNDKEFDESFENKMDSWWKNECESVTAERDEALQTVANLEAGIKAQDAAFCIKYNQLVARMTDAEETLSALRAWTYGRSLRDPGPDTYGEGMRDAKGQVKRILHRSPAQSGRIVRDTAPFGSQLKERDDD